MQPWNTQYSMIPWLYQLPPQFLPANPIPPPPPPPPPAPQMQPARTMYSIEEITPLIKAIVREIYDAEAATTLEFMDDDGDDDDEMDPSVSLEDLRTFTTITVIDNPEADSLCAVCHEEFAKGNIARKLRCNHEFHLYCIDRVLENSLSCPMCRMNVMPDLPDGDGDDDDDD